MSITRLSIIGGRLIDPANGTDAITDLHIADGRVLAHGNTPENFNAQQTLDASGYIVCPGLVDIAANLREPGFEHKASISSETRAAVSGGITTLVCPPDMSPVLDTPAVLDLIQRKADKAGRARVHALGALTRGLEGEHLSDMMALKHAGVVGLSNARQPFKNTLVLRRALEYAATHDMPVFLNAEDPDLANAGVAHEGPVSTRLGLPGIPEAAETASVARDLVLIEEAGVNAHFGRLSTAKGVHMLGRARHDGLQVSADVAIHQLYLTEVDLRDFNSQCHVRPPLRSERDRDGLRGALASGVINVICSDHQPHEADAKLRPFGETEPGISGLETLLPLVLRLADEGVLSLSDVLRCVTANPADILGLPTGRLQPGALADICIFDPDADWFVTAEGLRSRGHNTPFIGWEMQGRVKHTLVDGRLVYSDDHD
ncbi:MAG: dihydroorotase [Granulosicoccaceae bacterium]|jgi:dihydroorotase